MRITSNLTSLNETVRVAFSDFHLRDMVKSYLRYAPTGSFGVISTGANAIYDHSGKLAICAALERVIVWNIKQGVQIAQFRDSPENNLRAQVSCLALAPVSKSGSDTTRRLDESANDRLAVGYTDGSIRVWDWKTRSCLVTLNGHRGSVSTLAFDPSGTRLVSGSKDTDIIVWDLVAETGLFRLRGHKDQITSLHLLNVGGPSHLISSSKDTLVKVWDLATQHCVETVVGHRSEVWSTCMTANEEFLITGTSDPDLRVWRIDKAVLSAKITQQVASQKKESIDKKQGDDDEKPALSLFGLLPKKSQERVANLVVHDSQRYFGCQTADKTIELFRIKTEEELKRKLRRKKKRQADKDQQDGEVALKVGDQFASFRVIKATAKVHSFTFVPAPKDREPEVIQFMVALTNNAIDVYSFSPNKEDADIDLVSSLDIPGHRSDIRALALSSDDDLLVSAGNSNLKVWNVNTQQCLRTLPTNGTYALCCAFLPGNRHVVIGTKTGELELYDTWSSTLLESIKAHDGAVWSLDIRPDKLGMVSGGADKEVKFWDFGAIEDPEYSATTRKLSLMHMRTLKMSDEVLCVKYSPNQNLIAVSLLDATIKVFYADSLKFFLNMYGHKLPVLTMDISGDNSLLITGSADKNIKIWGLDFGDCHKSIFAHQDSVMQVRFVPQTHYFFSCSKDKTIKYWDGDKFERIMTLEGHFGEVWTMCIGRWGNLVVSAGHDKSIRVWGKTDEQLFLEEEREKESEEQYERDLMETRDNQNEDEEAGTAAKMTMESLKAGERIIEALTIAEEEIEKKSAYEKALQQGLPGVVTPELNPLLLAMRHDSAEQHVLHIVSKIKSADLEEALMVLPFSKVLTMFQVMHYWIKRQWNMALTCRILIFLLKTHQNQIAATRLSSLRISMDEMKTMLRQALQSQKDQIGCNLAGLMFVRRQWELEHVSEFVDMERDISVRARKTQKGQKVVMKRTLPSN